VLHFPTPGFPSHPPKERKTAVSYCEDYPCCGHTPLDPCEPQWYDKPGAFDLTKNPHALCDHENGDCEVM
jgi:hypothetical protein